MKTKVKTQQRRTPTLGRRVPLAQVPPLAVLLLFLFEFTFNLNLEKKLGAGCFAARTLVLETKQINQTLYIAVIFILIPNLVLLHV